MADLFLIGLASPRQYRRLPARGKRGANVWWSKPQAAAHSQLALARRLLDLGQHVAIVPPLSRPVPELLQAAHWDADDTLTAKHEPALWTLALPGDDDALALGATVIPAHLRDDNHPAVVIADHQTEPARAHWKLTMAQRLRDVLNDNYISMVERPSIAEWSDPGSAAIIHLRSRTQPNTDRLLACHQRASTMPKELLPRKAETRGAAEAQRASFRAGGLQRGHALFARQLWSATDVGCEFIDQLAVSGPGFLCIHQTALGDQHDVLGAIDRHIKDVRVLLIDRRQMPVEHCIQHGVLGGMLITTDTGTHYLSANSCSQGPGKRWLQTLSDHDIHVDGIEADLNALGGSLARCVLRIPDAQPEWLKPHAICDYDRITKLEAWAEQHLPTERLPVQISNPDTSADSAAQQALHQILN